MYGNDASQAPASGDRGVLAEAGQATAEVFHNLADTGQELAAMDGAGPYGAAKRLEWTSEEAWGKVMGRGRGCAKMSQVM